MRVTTESGAVYEIEGLRFRRVSDTDPLRRDGEWIRLLSPPAVVKGQPMRLECEPLAADAMYTLRETTPVADVDWLA